MSGRSISDRWRKGLAVLRSARLAGAAAAIVFCIVAILFLAQDVRTRLNALERANSDNSQWVMMQTEVEVLRLQGAVLTARDDPSSAALDEVRRWFNVFYSRVAMLEQSTVYAPLLSQPDYISDHNRLRQFLDGGVGLIDGPDTSEPPFE